MAYGVPAPPSLNASPPGRAKVPWPVSSSIPARTSASRGSRPPWPSSASCLVTSRAAAATALPVPIVVDEPYVGPVLGRSVSPHRTSTWSAGIPSSSAAIWPSTVCTPVPMSCTFVSTTAPPRRSRMLAAPGNRKLPIVQVAMPCPMTQGPSHRGRWCRVRHP
jgi:hypothetical protein